MERITASGRDGLRTLERGLAVLELLAGAERGFPLSDVATRLGLSVAVCHRMLSTLVKAGYVEQDPRTRWYQLGLKVLELRGAMDGPLRIVASVRPYLRDLMLRAGLRVHLAVYRGGDIVYIDRVDTTDTLARFVPLGRRAPAYATSLGKAILAFLPAEDIDAYLAAVRFTAFTPNTITSAEALRRELALTRERGYALDRTEHERDTFCVGAPIFDYTGNPIAALSTAGPAAQVGADVARLSLLVKTASAEASQRFGHYAADDPRTIAAR
ncbi:MAG: IclR family transcriptional regulator [Alphaproteobacteria bacterium]|nr:IclR family transcriptional regulator [Alphaproteobacteria bacterium]